MSSLPTYSFLPWLRQGIANQITALDLDTNVKVRASVQVQLSLNANLVEGGTQTEIINRPVSLIGPGDIVGIESRAIVRTDPRHWITNFEPNYLPGIEFYDEDLPWRYTPAGPDLSLHRLRPWIMLVVMKEDEFSEGKNIKGKPLPFIVVPNGSVFPPADQLWAWAHVHINRGVTASDSEIVSSNMGAVLPKFKAILDQDPDLAYSRIVSPRRLEESTAYHAFLVPVFESGRLAGLGLDPSGTPNATFSAWENYPAGTRPEPQHYPVYHRWYFRTGTKGDFEYLVRLLEAKPANPRVGTRDMDVQYPAPNLPGITEPELGGVLRLGGALRVPRLVLNPDELAEAEKYDQWAIPGPHPFQEKLAAFINLAEDYDTKSALDANAGSKLGEEVENDPDPMITPPLYGRWHALAERLLEDRDGNPLSPTDNWVHELNLDPRFRVSAGFGTGVIQANQEQYMDAAWEQIGDVLEANRRIRLGLFAREAGAVWYHKHFMPLKETNLERSLGLSAPLLRRVMVDGQTAHHRLKASLIPQELLSTPARRLMRPGGRLVRSVTFDGSARADNLLARINDGEITATPPKATPPGAPTVEDLADRFTPPDIPDWAAWILRNIPWWRMGLIGLIAIFALLIFTIVCIPVSVPAIAALVVLYRRLTAWERELHATEAVRGSSQTPEAVDRLPNNPNFTISQPEDGFTPAPGASDSPEATRFKRSLKDANRLVTASEAAGATPPRVKVDLEGIAAEVANAIDPDRTVPKRILGTIFLPDWISSVLVETFQEAMAYPEFDIPMYKPLVDMSTELFLPNIQLIEQNSITLLETNQKFIESYMVGLNHEFARELLWREYPTDQRGSYFRQFWDASSYLNTDPSLDVEALREKLRDIPMLHRWSRFSKLGDHDHREEGGASEEEVVLVIRGELLKKYPNAVIYAHRARWQPDNDNIDKNQERRLVELTPAEVDNPPLDKVKTPLYQAKVDPDIYFAGFDLTTQQVVGDSGETPGDDPGWFFVIKERPGEPRFGLDIDQQPALNVWNDLSWEDVLAGDPGIFIPTNLNFSLVEPTGAGVQEKHVQWVEDKDVKWNASANAAELAYILYQSPVLVAVHASEMLRSR